MNFEIIKATIEKWCLELEGELKHLEEHKNVLINEFEKKKSDLETETKDSLKKIEDDIEGTKNKLEGVLKHLEHHGLDPKMIIVSPNLASSTTQA